MGSFWAMVMGPSFIVFVLFFISYGLNIISSEMAWKYVIFILFCTYPVRRACVVRAACVRGARVRACVPCSWRLSCRAEEGQRVLIFFSRPLPGLLSRASAASPRRSATCRVPSCFRPHVSTSCAPSSAFRSRTAWSTCRATSRSLATPSSKALSGRSPGAALS